MAQTQTLETFRFPLRSNAHFGLLAKYKLFTQHAKNSTEEGINASYDHSTTT